MAQKVKAVRLSRTSRLLMLGAAAAAAIAAVYALPRIPQDPSYHHFADRRSCLGIPNCLDVLSNVLFLLVGVAGLAFLFGAKAGTERRSFASANEKWPYEVFFFGIALTCACSAYYHWEPSNSRLMWDRLPMAFAFMSILAACIMERINVKAGLILLGPLVLYGAGSVISWHLSELRGAGDLRAYVLAQFLPVVLIPLMMLLFPSRYTRGGDLLVAVGFYALAKLFESFDKPIFDAGQLVSGHTLKHVVAAASGYWILRMLRRRSIVANGTISSARAQRYPD